jgi:hypothetical protein
MMDGFKISKVRSESLAKSKSKQDFDVLEWATRSPQR